MDVNGKNYVSKITEEQIGRLIKTLKGFTFPLTDYAPFEYAVVTAGGVCCDEVNPYTMGVAEGPGTLLCGRGTGPRRQYGRIQPADRLFDGPSGGHAEKIGEMRIGGRTIGLGFTDGSQNCTTDLSAPVIFAGTESIRRSYIIL